VNSAESFEDEESGLVHEFVTEGDQEKIARQHLFTFSQFGLRIFKVKVYVESFQELDDWVSVRVALLLNDLHCTTEEEKKKRERRRTLFFEISALLLWRLYPSL
jgi:hypothetical protein